MGAAAGVTTLRVVIVVVMGEVMGVVMGVVSGATAWVEDGREGLSITEGAAVASEVDCVCGA